jgi:hypothetical protein
VPSDLCFLLKNGASVSSLLWPLRQCPILRKSTHSATMASYFRNFFGGHPSSNLQGNSKTHKRSASTPSAASANPNLSYIYAAPGTTPSVASQASRERSNSHVHAARANYNGPSPLRYPTYDPDFARSTQPAPQQPPLQSKPGRMHLYRTASDKPGDLRPCLFQLFYLTILNPSSRTLSDLLAFQFVH